MSSFKTLLTGGRRQPDLRVSASSGSRAAAAAGTAAAARAGLLLFRLVSARQCRIGQPDLKSLNNLDPTPEALRRPGSWSSTAPDLLGVGLGYQFNSWLRFDATGEYRGRTAFPRLATYERSWIRLGGQLYRQPFGSVFLANAYVDLGTWWCVTPFIGGGVGAAYNRISGFQDTGVNTSFGVAQPASVTYAGDAGNWNFAWDLTAGLAYKVTPGFTVELAYRYLNLGSATTGANYSFDGSFTPPQYPWTMKTITSNDFMLGLRWNIGEPAASPPLIRKG